MSTAVLPVDFVSRVADRPVSPEPTGMTHLPPEIFRRRTVLSLIERIEKQFDRIDEYLMLENEVAARAVRADLAAQILSRLDRHDLQLQFERMRDEAVAKGKEVVKRRMRDYSGRRPKGFRQMEGFANTDPKPVTRHTPDDQPKPRSK